jgi:hypothetical protein
MATQFVPNIIRRADAVTLPGPHVGAVAIAVEGCPRVTTSNTQRSLRSMIAPQRSEHRFVSIESVPRKFLLNLLSIASLRTRRASHPLWMC